MGCKCAERRQLTGQAIQNLRQGNVAAAGQNVKQFGQTIRSDLRAVRAALAMRPTVRR